MKSLSKMLRGSCAQKTCAIVTSGALVFSTLPTMAQDQPPPGAQAPPPGAQAPQPPAPQLGRAELEKLVAPIALYPDDLVAQILTASTYPIEVVEASRWVNAHPNIHGDPLQDAMQQQPWDPSVKGLTAVPQVLAMMNDQLTWTQQLGEAFLAQPDDVSNAIQQLRVKAEANGNLRSSDKIRVRRMPPPEPLPPPEPIPVGVDEALLPPPPPPEYIVIEPVDPGIYYVPVYDPYVVYGPWLYPAYRPFYWYPPGYVVGAAVIGFSVGFFVGSALWCHYNWGYYGGWHGGGPVTINVVNFNRFNRSNLVAGQNHWQFEAAHRGSVGFQNASLRQQFGEPRNFQNFQRTGALPTNPQGTQQGNQGQFHIQGNQGQFHIQGNQGTTLQGNQSRGGTGPLNTKLNTNTNTNLNPNTHGNTTTGLNPNTHVNTNTNLNPNTHVNTNTNLNPNTHVNTNTNLNPNTHVNTTTGLNPNTHLNVNPNASGRPNQNQFQNVNRNLNVNRNFNAGGGGGGGNPNRGGNNVTRNLGPPPGGGGGGGKGGGGGGGGGGKGGKPEDHHH